MLRVVTDGEFIGCQYYRNIVYINWPRASIVHSQNASQCPHLHMQASKTNFLQVYPLNPPICVLPESFLSSASWMSAYFATTT